MALRKAVGAKTLKLTECLLGELLCVTALDHAVDELVLEFRYAAGELERRHGAAKLVGFAGRETGALDRDPHGLFLEQRYTQRLTQNLFQLRLRKHDGLLALAPAQIRTCGATISFKRRD